MSLCTATSARHRQPARRPPLHVATIEGEIPMNLAVLLRRQLHSPLFALTVFVLVAAVVAVNATAFGAIHALRWKALPYADGDQLVELRGNMQKFGLMGGLNWYLLGRVAGDHAHQRDLHAVVDDAVAIAVTHDRPRGDEHCDDPRTTRELLHLRPHSSSTVSPSCVVSESFLANVLRPMPSLRAASLWLP